MTGTEPMTQKQHDTLTAELQRLEGTERAAAIATIAETRSEGDLSENFGYHDAKNAQGLLERRITILTDQLQRAVIIEGSADTVAAGSIVIVSDEAGEKLEVEISNTGGNGVVSTSSPLGAALYGRQVGDSVQVKAPRSTWTATIVQIKTS
jgi:transcription elongation factor GreA